MCYTVFFKLDKIQVNGCSVYSQAQIIDEIGAQKGESLFKVNISNAEKLLVGKLPYVRSVKISRQFPTTLKVDVQEEKVLGAVYTNEGLPSFPQPARCWKPRCLPCGKESPALSVWWD